MYSPWNGMARQKRPIARIRILSSGFALISLPFQKRLLRPTESRPVWISAEVVLGDPTSDDSGTTCELLIEALLRIALLSGALLPVIRQPASHRPLPDRRYQARPP